MTTGYRKTSDPCQRLLASGSATAHTRVSEGHPNKPGRELQLELKSMNMAAAGDAVGVLLCRGAGVPGCRGVRFPC
ncbi:MAG: hypothetical protein QF735_08570, partial [Phycisphaeraceae bacterium]|nr:hypothetical protein [Phycisphaeraceae bacterium]